MRSPKEEKYRQTNNTTQRDQIKEYRKRGKKKEEIKTQPDKYTLECDQTINQPTQKKTEKKNKPPQEIIKQAQEYL